ncbi:substrate-binding domain-containing protein [Cohnella yongneupensis]|uniref:Substrate-binding domain-containing protein n=1 Tax=Cohnella yongneupensis TaxID=425006 RepID=A0ABW0R093_9BACL
MKQAEWLKICGLVLLIGILLVTGGCKFALGGIGSDTDDSGKNAKTDVVTTVTAGQTAAMRSPVPTTVAADHLTFGIIYPMAHPFYEMITEYAKEAAAKEGVQLIVKAPDEANLEQQIRMMETLIKQKVDGIAIDPVDKFALAPVIDKAIQAGIPVICFESDSPKSRRLAYIGSDNRQAGERMGKLLDGLLEGKGMVIMETGMSGMTSLGERLDGLLNYLNRQTEIQVLEVRYNEGKEAAALSNLEQMIEAHPHFDAFVALDVMSGSASVLVWKASGLDRYALTFGMMPEIQQAIDNGQITAAVSQNEKQWGERIVTRLLEATQGKSIPPFDDMGTTETPVDNG